MRETIRQKHEEIIRMCFDKTVTDDEVFNAIDEMIALDPTQEEVELLQADILINMMMSE